MASRQSTIPRECAAEFIGTYILVFFGVGSVHAAVLTGAQSGIWQIGVVWAVAISLAIYVTGAVSGAHINPAITVAFAVHRGFPRRKILGYVGSQFCGAFAAAGTLHGLFGNLIRHFERANGIVRGGPGSELSGMVFGEYFPNPALFGPVREAAGRVTHMQAFLGEAVGTAFLAFFVFALTDPANRSRPGRALVGPFIGLTVGIVISVLAPLTQAGLNPARDFGPRVYSWLAGWGHIAIPGPRGGFFTVYILAPLVGAVFGAGVYRYALGRPRGIPPTDGQQRLERIDA